MALVDDPPDFIRTMFRKAAHGDAAQHCRVIRDGEATAGLPLEEGELVYGVYRGKYHFTPLSLVILERAGALRLPWGHISSCSSTHGEGAATSVIRTIGGQEIHIRLGELGAAWGGLSQLYHGMIARWGARSAFGEPLMSLEAFFQEADNDDAFAANRQLKQSLGSLRRRFAELAARPDVRAVLVVPHNRDVEQGLYADTLVVVSDSPASVFEPFAWSVGAGGVRAAAADIRRRLPIDLSESAALYIWWD